MTSAETAEEMTPVQTRVAAWAARFCSRLVFIISVG